MIFLGILLILIDNRMSALLKRQPNQKYLDLTITFADSKGDDVSGPPVRFHFSD